MIGTNLRKNNVTIALNVLRIKKEKIYPAYVSKRNSNCETQVIFLMIPNREGREARSERRVGKSEGSEAKSKGRRRWHYLQSKNCLHY